MNNDFIERKLIPTLVAVASICTAAIIIALTVRFIAELFGWM